MKTLFLSDIHANLAALKAVLYAEPDSERVVCLGDLVDYGPQPAECIALVRAFATVVVQGNHDYAVGNAADPRCSEAYKHLARVTQDYTMSTLGSADLEYLARLPLEARFETGGANFAAVHAAPSDPLFKYRLPDTADDVWKAETVTSGCPDFLLLGHTHLPCVKKIGATTIVNPGSVGQPKDGDPRASYAVWENRTVTLKRAEYDVDLTVRALREMAFEPSDIEALARILLTGGKL